MHQTGGASGVRNLTEGPGRVWNLTDLTDLTEFDGGPAQNLTDFDGGPPPASEFDVLSPSA